jgi:hypothetical protein
VPLLEEAKHEATAVNLPGDDAHAGLSVYAERVLEAIGTREGILVAQSRASPHRWCARRLGYGCWCSSTR